MRAACYHEFGGPIEIEDVPSPSAVADGVVLEVGAAGLCRSDWHGWMGHDPDVSLPHVPGHELAGTIVEIGGDVSRFAVGQRVTVPFCVGCGRCESCRAGQLQICDDHFQPGFTAWGAFAEKVAIPHADANLAVLPDSLAFDAAASLGCRFITAWRAVMQQGRLAQDEWVSVHGCGGVGLAAIQIAVAAGANVIAVDIDHDALAMAADIGATIRVDARSTDVADAVRDASGGGVHLAVDALGSAVTCRDGIQSLRKRGRHVQVGLLAGDQAQPRLPMELVINRELEIIGSHGLSARDLPGVLAMVAAGRLDPGRLVERRIGLEDVPAAIPAMGDYGMRGVTIVTPGR